MEGFFHSPTSSELLDPSFLFALEVGEKFSVQPMRFTALLKMTRVKARTFYVLSFLLSTLLSYCCTCASLVSFFSCDIGFPACFILTTFLFSERILVPLLYLIYTKLYFHGVQLLGRTINLRNLISERLNKIFRENIEFLFDRFESQDICAIVVSVWLTNYAHVVSPQFSFSNFTTSISGIGKAPWSLATFSWIAIQRSDSWFIYSHVEWDARECISCFIF